MLRLTMRANALSCLVFGVLLAFMPSRVGAFLSDDSPAPTIIICALGIVLLLNGTHLVWASNLAKPSKLLLTYFTAGDYAWVVASIIVLAADFWVTTTSGVITTVAVSVMVGLLGTLQLMSITSRTNLRKSN